MNTNVPVPGWGRKSETTQGTDEVIQQSIGSKTVNQAEMKVKQLLQGCTFTKEQYDHILSGFQNKTDSTTSAVIMHMLLTLQVKLFLFMKIVKCGS